MESWAVDPVGVRELLSSVDEDALAIDEHGDSLTRAVEDAVESLTAAERSTAATALAAFFDQRVLIPENLLAYIAATTGAVSAATAAILNGAETMSLNIQAAEMAADLNIDDAVARIARES